MPAQKSGDVCLAESAQIGSIYYHTTTLFHVPFGRKIEQSQILRASLRGHKEEPGSVNRDKMSLFHFLMTSTTLHIDPLSFAAIKILAFAWWEIRASRHAKAVHPTMSYAQFCGQIYLPTKRGVCLFTKASAAMVWSSVQKHWVWA